MHEELERTHRLAENYKPRYFWSIFYSFFPKSFKKIFKKYALEKEELLLLYEHLHNDIKSKKLDPLSTEFIGSKLSEMTRYIDSSARLLSQLVSHSHIQEEILIHEKAFFQLFLRDYQNDILVWVWVHETSIFWETQGTTDSRDSHSISESIKLLKLKKAKLKEYIEKKSL